MKYSFKNDYSEIAHKKVLEKLISCANEQNVGYGLDDHTIKACSLIKKAMNFDDCDIHFLVGGTQTNLVTISSFLRPYEAVISAISGHINVHETGAIEGTGHKVLTCQTINGKVTTLGIEEVLSLHSDEHMVKPKMLYISHSTEIGTVYTKRELTALRELCDQRGLYLFLDGARLASGLCSNECDFTLHDLATLTDAFYIGGTKNGCLFGEALILINKGLKEDFRYYIKHKGALLAKGFVNAINFEALFEDDLFFEIGKHENEMAKFLADGLEDLGFDFMCDSSTNQIFPVFEVNLIEALKEDYLFEIWSRFDENSFVVRLVTSFATTKEDCEEFLTDISNKIE